MSPTCYTPQQATPLPNAELLLGNETLAEELGLEANWLTSDEALQVLSGNQPFRDFESKAFVYAGHQFGYYVPQLGDGRALWIGEVPSQSKDFPRWELQLKGAGPTPYSRAGDGRAVLRSSIREFLCSEAMYSLGIPTTRALSLVGSDLPVYRETPETAAIVCRVSPSFTRFGSFEYWTHTRNDVDTLKTLLADTITDFYPELETLEGEEQVSAFLQVVTKRTAKLTAQWQAVGFAHGVLNTDNCSILGLTLDYGPFGFMEAFDPGFICNHSDDQGRYAFDQQPNIMHWNLHALASALKPVLSIDKARDVLSQFEPIYASTFMTLYREKLGLQTVQEDDISLVKALFSLMHRYSVDYTRFFRLLASYHENQHSWQQSFETDLRLPEGSTADWLTLYQTRLEQEPTWPERASAMKQVNPKFILRNYLAQQVIEAAEAGDYKPLEQLYTCLKHPFDEQPENDEFALHPPDWAKQICVSCSS